MTPLAFAKTAALIGGIFAIRIISGYRIDRRKRAALATSLVDPVLLETVFASRDGDDADLLAEIRDTLIHLNRQAYAEEFWNVGYQIADLDKKLPKKARPTLRAALMRMLNTDDRWLQIVGAKASGALNVDEAAPRMRALVDRLGDDEIDARFRVVLTEALNAVDPAAAS